MLTVIRVDLDGDGDHDAVIDDVGPDDDLEETLPGIIVLANQDDDDSDGVVDHMDNIVNTSADAGDLAPIVIRRMAGLVVDWPVRLTLEDATNIATGIGAADVVRVFPNNTPNTAALLGGGTTTVTLAEDDPAHNADVVGLGQKRCQDDLFDPLVAIVSFTYDNGGGSLRRNVSYFLTSAAARRMICIIFSTNTTRAGTAPGRWTCSMTSRCCTSMIRTVATPWIRLVTRTLHQPTTRSTTGS